jgi:hypothetical protein
MLTPESWLAGHLTSTDRNFTVIVGDEVSPVLSPASSMMRFTFFLKGKLDFKYQFTDFQHLVLYLPGNISFDFEELKLKNIGELGILGTGPVSFDALAHKTFDVDTLRFGTGIKLPNRNWGLLYKLKQKQKMSVVIHEDEEWGTDLLTVIDDFDNATSLLDFQSRLLDDELEDYF